MKSGLHDVTVTLGARLVTFGTALGVQSCLAWSLGPAGRGAYAVCIMLTAVLGLVFELGSAVSGTYFVASKKMTVSEGVTHVLIWSACGSLAAVATGILLMQFPFSFWEKAPAAAFYLSLAYIPVSMLMVSLLGLLAAVRDFIWSAAVLVVGGVLNLAFMLLCVGLWKWDVNGALGVNLCATLASVVLLCAVLSRKYGVTFVRPSVAHLGAMLRYGVRYYVGKVSNQLNFRAGTVVLAFVALKEEIGLFDLAILIPMQIMIVPEAVSAVLMPRSAADEAGRKQLVAQCSRVTGLACAAVLLVLVLLAKPVVAVVFSPEFLPAVPLLQVAALGFALRAASRMLEPYFMGTNRPGIVSFAVTAGLAVNLLLMWVLMPVMGLTGAAWATTLNYAVSSGILVVQFSRQSGLGLAGTWLPRRADWTLVSDSIRRLCVKAGGAT